MPAQPNQPDIYSRVTATILAQLEMGVRPWQQPWQGGTVSMPKRHNGEPYHGVNILMLWLAALEKGYSNPRWMTFKQASDLGGHVRKGEHGSLIVYANTVTKTENQKDEFGNNEEIEKVIPFMRGYKVFNVDQIDGLPEEYYAQPDPLPHLNDAQRLEAVEQFFANIPALVEHGGNRAYYSQSAERVQLPEFKRFRDPESYYATRGHESVHWTRHPKRLNRNFEQKRFGDQGYAMEELVAEIGAAFLCASIGITPDTTREDHAAYIGSWLQVLKQDKHAIFTAASHAQRAVDHLQEYQKEKTQEHKPMEVAPEQDNSRTALQYAVGRRMGAGKGTGRC